VHGETIIKRESISSADSSSSSSVYQHQDLAYSSNSTPATVATTATTIGSANLQTQNHHNHHHHHHQNNHEQHSIYANSYYGQTITPSSQHQIHHSPYSFDQTYHHEYHASGAATAAAASSDLINGPTAVSAGLATNPWQHTQHHDPCSSPIIHNVTYATNGYHQGLPNNHHNHHRHLMLEQNFATANSGQASLGGADPIPYH
jgi:hypothetical protein